MQVPFDQMKPELLAACKLNFPPSSSELEDDQSSIDWGQMLSCLEALSFADGENQKEDWVAG